MQAVGEKTSRCMTVSFSLECDNARRHASFCAAQERRILRKTKIETGG
jgi:hypothetical protein